MVNNSKITIQTIGKKPFRRLPKSVKLGFSLTILAGFIYGVIYLVRYLISRYKKRIYNKKKRRKELRQQLREESKIYREEQARQHMQPMTGDSRDYNWNYKTGKTYYRNWCENYSEQRKVLANLTKSGKQSDLDNLNSFNCEYYHKCSNPRRKKWLEDSCGENGHLSRFNEEDEDNPDNQFVNPCRCLNEPSFYIKNETNLNED